jgi:hypothetical protein
MYPFLSAHAQKLFFSNFGGGGGGGTTPQAIFFVLRPKTHLYPATYKKIKDTARKRIKRAFRKSNNFHQCTSIWVAVLLDVFFV